jgi:hypothetical protein
MQDHARQAGVAAYSSSIRREALRKLEQLIGPDIIPGWLRIPQPAFDGMTAGQMLQRDPQRLLDRLEQIEADDDLDEIAGETERTERHG